MKALLLNKLRAVTAVLAALGACAVAAGTVLLAARQPEAEQPGGPPQPGAGADRAPPGDNKPNRVDRYGDPLPPGAVARLGTVRLRHTGMVYSVAFSPDGKAVASGDGNGEMRLWDAATGKLLRAFVDPDGNAVMALAFSPDGKWLASNKGRLSLWDVSTGTRRPGFATDYRGGVRSLAFSPDGSTLAVTSERDPIVRFYSVATGELSSQINEGHTWTVYAAAYSPDGKALATAGEDSIARVWDLATRKALHQFRLPEEVRDVAWAPDGKSLATATQRAVTVWEAATEAKLHQFDRGVPGPRSLAFSPDGKRLASADRIWDLSGSKEVCTYEGQIWGRVAYAPDGRAVATAGSDGAVRLHDPDTGKEFPHLRAAGGAGAFVWAAFAPDGGRLLTLRLHTLDEMILCCYDHSADRVQSWAADGRDVREFAIDRCGSAAALSPDGAVFALAGNGGSLTLWDRATGKRLRQLVGDKSDVIRGVTPAIAFSPDNRLVASAGNGEDVRVWEVRTGQLVQTLKGHRRGVCFLAFAPDGRRLVSAGIDQSARFWDLATGKEWRAPAALAGRVRGASTDGRTWALLVEEDEGGRKTWSLRIGAVETGKETRRLGDVSTSLCADDISTNLCAFAPDGRSVAVQERDSTWSPKADNTIRVIELATGGVRARFRGHRGRLMTLAFSADGTTLASGGFDSTALLWDLVGRGDGSPGELAAPEWQALWEKLGSDDAETAHQAMGAFSRAPGPTVAWVRERLPPAQKPDGERVARLVNDLDDDRFAVREEAEAALKRLGELAGPALRRALDGKPSAEVRRRATRLLEQIDREITPGQLRSLRAVEVLERLGTPEARKVLEDLARGTPEARQTREARASLDRLAGRQRSNGFRE